MPYRRRARRRRNRRRGRRRNKGKVLVPRSMVSYNGPKNFKLRLSTVVSTTTDGKMQFHISPSALAQFITKPFPLSQTTTIGLNETTLVQSLFDQYRVKGVRIQWIPKYTNLEQLPGVQQGTKAYGPLPACGMVYDADQFGQVFYKDMVTRDRFKLVNPLRRWSQYFKVKPSIQGSTTAGSLVLPGGWMNLQTVGQNTGQTISCESETAYIESDGSPFGDQEMGTAILTCYVQFKMRQ